MAVMGYAVCSSLMLVVNKVRLSVTRHVLGTERRFRAAPVFPSLHPSAHRSIRRSGRPASASPSYCFLWGLMFCLLARGTPPASALVRRASAAHLLRGLGLARGALGLYCRRQARNAQSQVRSLLGRASF